MNCPICKSKSKTIKILPKSFQLDTLGKYFKTIAPKELITIEYKINKCIGCTLEFAVPLLPGSDIFYNWITVQPNYYPFGRWEYDIVFKRITSREAVENKILDIGCGSGEFLEKFVNTNVLALGLDTTESSVEICKSKGLNVSCKYLDKFVADESNINSFDSITAFHVLEHVPDPLEFVSDMKKLMKQRGSIFLSTPYSPMFFETDWFDPLNHPPHHMTRWNEKAYNTLAKELNMNIEFFFPKPEPLLKRINATFKLKHNLSGNMFSVWSSIPFNLKSFIKILLNQIKRAKTSKNVTAPDLVLVRLEKK